MKQNDEYNKSIVKNLDIWQSELGKKENITLNIEVETLDYIVIPTKNESDYRESVDYRRIPRFIVLNKDEKQDSTIVFISLGKRNNKQNDIHIESIKRIGEDVFIRINETKEFGIKKRIIKKIENKNSIQLKFGI